MRLDFTIKTDSYEDTCSRRDSDSLFRNRLLSEARDAFYAVGTGVLNGLAQIAHFIDWEGVKNKITPPKKAPQPKPQQRRP